MLASMKIDHDSPTTLNLQIPTILYKFIKYDQID